MIYVVLGMHKSGTTLISQALHESGINMGEFSDDLNYDTGNKFERHESQEANRQLLQGHLVPNLPFLIGGFVFPLYNEAGYRRNRDGTAIMIRQATFEAKMQQPAQRQAIRNVIDTCSANYTDWGFKDPRTCLTYDAWKEELPEHKIIVVYRSYTQLFKRRKITALKIPLLFRLLHAWTLHNLFILKHLKESQTPSLVLSYEAMMSDADTFDRLSAFVGQKLTDVRDPKMYRNRTTTAPELPKNARWMVPFLPANPDDVYAELTELSAQSKAVHTA